MKKVETHEILLEEGNIRVIYYEGERRTQIRIQNLSDENKGEIYMTPADVQALTAMLEELVL